MIEIVEWRHAVCDGGASLLFEASDITYHGYVANFLVDWLKLVMQKKI